MLEINVYHNIQNIKKNGYYKIHRHDDGGKMLYRILKPNAKCEWAKDNNSMLSPLFYIWKLEDTFIVMPII